MKNEHVLKWEFWVFTKRLITSKVQSFPERILVKLSTEVSYYCIFTLLKSDILQFSKKKKKLENKMEMLVFVWTPCTILRSKYNLRKNLCKKKNKLIIITSKKITPYEIFSVLKILFALNTYRRCFSHNPDLSLQPGLQSRLPIVAHSCWCPGRTPVLLPVHACCFLL